MKVVEESRIVVSQWVSLPGVEEGREGPTRLLGWVQHLSEDGLRFVRDNLQIRVHEVVRWLKSAPFGFMEESFHFDKFVR